MWQFVQSCRIISLPVHLHMSGICPKWQVADTCGKQFVQDHHIAVICLKL